MMMRMLRSMARRAVTAAALTGSILVWTSAASAETLMMPKRDALTGSAVVVWGVSTLANGTAFTLDYGDGSLATTGTVTDRSYIAFPHTYATQGTYTATLTVGSETATVEIRVFDAALLPGGVTGENYRGLRINMAIQDGLRWLWYAQFNRAGNFPAGLTTNWGGYYSESHAALVTLAFENHGFTLSNDIAAPTGLYEKYIVARGLNYVLAGLSKYTLTSQTAGSPCVGAGIEVAPCVGFGMDRGRGHSAYETPVAMLPFAASGALARVNGAVGITDLHGKTYGEILQRMANTVVWGQNENGNGRGGWGYVLNNQANSDGSTVGWALLSLLDSEAAGITVPAFVKTEFAFQLTKSHNSNGSLDYQSDGNAAALNSVGMEKAGIALQGLFFTGQTYPFVAGSAAEATVKYISDRWLSGRIGGDANWGCGTIPNKGCGYSMFNNFKGLKLQGINTLTGVTRPAGPGAIPAGDWYADYQDWLIANQTSPASTTGGNWGGMSFSCCESSQAAIAALAELILSPVALVLPDADKFSTVGLSPPTRTDIEGGTHTVIAKAESTGGTPVPGATVTFTIISGPNAGVTGSGVTNASGEATFTYTDAGPDGTYGTDRIQASIGSLNSNIVEMIWTPKNRPPVATDNAYTTDEDTLLAGNVVTDAPPDSDDDGDTLVASLVSGTANGSLTLNADGSFTYSPNANYCGPDGFTYTVNDGLVDSNVATVSIDVTCVNDPPVAEDDAVSTNEDTPVSGDVTGNDTSVDVDGDTLSWAKTSDPANGSVIFNADGTFTYTPAANFCGTDSFGYAISDGTASDPATVTIAVACVNDPPVATDNAYATNEDTPVSGNAMTDGVADSDVDGDALTAALVSGTSNGTLTFNADGSFTYSPNLNYFGADSFTYKVNDGQVDSNVATVTITIAPVNDVPVCSAAAPSIGQIWPPNHRLVNVNVLGVTDIEGGITIRIDSIFQDEPTNTQGDGNTPIDGYGVGTSTAQVRAERSGSPRVPGNGRVYHISFTGTDNEGATCTGTVKVGVPHDQGQRRIPVDDGPLFKSTGS
ncbi:MAG: Ig-like domain-containing protein [Acidobacteriota bacterium]